jgi:hypothetical protein
MSTNRAKLTTVLVLLVCTFASAGPATKTYPRTNGWKWTPDTTNKGTPSCMDKFGHDAGSMFISYFGSITSLAVNAEVVTISASPYVPSMIGTTKNAPKGYYMVTSQDSFYGKISIGGHTVWQLVSVDVDSHLTSATITMLGVDGTTVLCDDSFYTILEVKPQG